MANATTGGWGNLGGGITQILMPVVYNGMTAAHEPFVAWRYAMFIPGFMHILGGILILFFSTDLPDGNYAVLKKTGAMNEDNGVRVLLNALTNYRCAILDDDMCARLSMHYQTTLHTKSLLAFIS
jgi:MFS transporter, NNP family, nitrate/nitrite transporter